VVHGSQPRFTVEEIIAAIHRAVRFVRSRAESFGIDPGKLGITGSSAGGHLGLMVVTRGGPGKPQPLLVLACFASSCKQSRTNNQQRTTNNESVSVLSHKNSLRLP
jgi:acetyl esterase/lipase